VLRDRRCIWGLSQLLIRRGDDDAWCSGNQYEGVGELIALGGESSETWKEVINEGEEKEEGDEGDEGEEREEGEEGEEGEEVGDVKENEAARRNGHDPVFVYTWRARKLRSGGGGSTQAGAAGGSNETAQDSAGFFCVSGVHGLVIRFGAQTDDECPDV